MALKDKSKKILLIVFGVAVLAIIPAIWKSPERASSLKRVQPYDIIVKYDSNAKDSAETNGPLRGKGMGSKDVKGRAALNQDEDYQEDIEHQAAQESNTKQQTQRGKIWRHYRHGSRNRDILNMVVANNRPRGIYKRRSGWLARHILCLGRTFYCALPSDEGMTVNLAKYNMHS